MSFGPPDLHPTPRTDGFPPPAGRCAFGSAYTPFVARRRAKATQRAATRSGAELIDAILSNPSPVKSASYFSLTPKEIASLTEALIAREDKNLDACAASKSNPSWDATIGPLLDSNSVEGILSNVITFPSAVSPDAATRNASLAASNRISAWAVDAGLRTDVYEALKAFNATPEAAALTGERARLLKFSLRDSRRAGLELPKDKRDQLATLRKRASKLAIDFQACLDGDTTTVSFTPEQLNGTSKEFIESRKKDPKDPSKLLLTVKYPDYTPVMEECTVESTRKAMEFAFNTVCADENTKRLDELISLRAQIAGVLGYPTWAAYVQETLMAKNPKRVGKFLTDLEAKLVKLRDEQMGVLLSLKRADKAAAKAPFEPRIRSWESAFYQRVVEKRDFKVDQEKIKEYFPIEHVISEMLKIYQEILSLKFVKDEELSKTAWAPGIDAYRVFDSKSNDLIGVFYLDLHPRDGKYGHAAMFHLQPPSYLLLNGKAKPQPLVGAAALVCNFPASTKTQPSLLPHSDVTTLFHEFGHLTHQVLGRTQLPGFAGTNVDTDFVEAPSQMLENWTWEKEALKRVSKHYKTGEPLPDDLIDKLIKSRNANGGIFNSRQLAYGLFDQSIHTSPSASSRDVYNATIAKVVGVGLQEGTAPAARFSHMVGYDAQYYSYLWSQVFSADMFETRFKKEGIFNPKPGMDYRTKVLGPGGSVDADVLLRNFLGRDPTQDAFLRSLGLNDASKAGGGGSEAGGGMGKEVARTGGVGAPKAESKAQRVANAGNLGTQLVRVLTNWIHY